MGEAWTVEEITDLLQVMNDTAMWKILDALLVKTRDPKILNKMIWMKTGDEVDHFVNYTQMMLSEIILYKETGVLAEEKNKERFDRMLATGNVESLYYNLTLNPQMSKGYVRSSDLVGCIACYYQGMDFRPHPMVSGVSSEGAKITIGTKETPEFLKPQMRNGVKVRTVTVKDIPY